MTTGTEGPDVLTHNSSTDTILGLGGDDIINLHLDGYSGSITVDGGDGFDTLTITAPYIYAMFPDLVSVTRIKDNYSFRLFYSTSISFSSIERLVIHGRAFQGERAFGFEPHLNDWRTGDTIDEIHVLGKESFPRTTLNTGGGDDKIYLGDVIYYSYGSGGAGDDLVDLTGVVKYDHVAGYGDEGNDRLVGGARWDRLFGGPGDDLLSSGRGNQDNHSPSMFFDAAGDHLDGGEGDDILYFGAWFDPADVAVGGEGRDELVLQGNYDLSMRSNITGIESLSLLSGANATFGDTAGNAYDYEVTMADGNVGASQQLIVSGRSLRAGEDFAFDGSEERDGRFLVFGGHGVDTLTGGSGNDLFVFEGDRWGKGDRVSGGAGRDSVVISAGTGLAHIEFAADSLAGIESISVNDHYASDRSQRPSYEFVLHNGNVAPGGTLIVNGSSLEAGQVIKVDARGVHDGRLMLFGGGGDDSLSGGDGPDTILGGGGADEVDGGLGHDTLTGGDGADSILGGSGADGLTGGGGADTFRYGSVSDSTVHTPDTIGDFQVGLDKIDLSGIDANTHADGDQAFTWIGSNAFDGAGAASAGQLRIVGAVYRRIEGDTDGDGVADLVIVLQLGTAPLGQGDFLL